MAIDAIHVFLDLEDTVITPAVPSFAATTLLRRNCDLIKDRVRQLAECSPGVPVHWHIFSFALHHESCLRDFENTQTRAMIEREMGVVFEQIPLLGSDIKQACCAQLGLHENTVSIVEVIEFWGKQLSFQLWVANNIKRFENCVVVLFDDVVSNTNLTFVDHATNVFFVHVPPWESV